MITAIFLVVFFNLSIFFILKEETSVYTVRDFFKYAKGAMIQMNVAAAVIIILGFIFELVMRMPNL
jgi:hypothetical protein